MTCRPCSTGRSARSATRSPTSGCWRSTGPAPTTSRARGPDASTTAPGFWNRDRIAARYAEVSGRDVAGLDFYVAFGYWKLACVLEGVYARYLGGALGDRDPAELQVFKDQVDAAATMAARRLEAT